MQFCQNRDLKQGLQRKLLPDEIAVEEHEQSHRSASKHFFALLPAGARSLNYLQGGNFQFTPAGNLRGGSATHRAREILDRGQLTFRRALWTEHSHWNVFKQQPGTLKRCV